MTENGTHQSWLTGKQVTNDKSAAGTQMALGWIGVVTLVAGIITLTASFNVTPATKPGYSPSLEAIQSATHTALVTMVCGGLLTLIGSIAVIALLAVKADAKAGIAS